MKINFKNLFKNKIVNYSFRYLLNLVLLVSFSFVGEGKALASKPVVSTKSAVSTKVAESEFDFEDAFSSKTKKSRKLKKKKKKSKKWRKKAYRKKRKKQKSKGKFLAKQKLKTKDSGRVKSQSEKRRQYKEGSKINTSLLEKESSDVLKNQKKNEEKKTWSFGLGYGLSSDLADEKKPRAYSHRLSLGGSYRFLNANVTVGLGVTGQYTSYGDSENREILLEDSDKTSFLSDVDLDVSKGFRLNNNHGLDVFGSLTFPTSPDSQEEGYNLYSAAGVSVNSKLPLGGLSASNTLSASYLSNDFKESPSSLLPNPMFGASYGLGVSYSFGTGFSFGVSGGVKVTQYTDETSETRFRNGVRLSYGSKRWGASLSYRNMSYADQDDNIDLFFLDEYRRLVSLGLKLKF